MKWIFIGAVVALLLICCMCAIFAINPRDDEDG